MPLTSSNHPGAIEGWGITFAMQQGVEIVRCHVGGDALEDIERSDNPGEAERMRIFERHRPAFEAIASRLFDEGREPRVTSKHLSR